MTSLYRLQRYASNINHHNSKTDQVIASTIEHLRLCIHKYMTIYIICYYPLVKNNKNNQIYIEATGEIVEDIPKGFTDLTKQTDGAIATFQKKAEKQYGIQFYPEKEQTVQGMDLLK